MRISDWSSDVCSSDLPARKETYPQGPPEILAAKYSPPEIRPRRVVKGGSWLCAPNFCLRYRPAARQPGELGPGSNHLSFRILKDLESPAPPELMKACAGEHRACDVKSVVSGPGV